MMRCPCLHAGNTRDHGVMCHYAGMTSLPCTLSPVLESESGRAIRVDHDGRLCVAVCQAHYAWRQTMSRLLGPCRCGAGISL
jgi:hypothetical protein